VLHTEQHVKPVTQQSVDAEEVGGKNALGLGGQELTPGEAAAARCGVDAGSLQDRPHRAGRKLVAESGEFALDPPVPQVGFSEARRSTSWRSSGAVDWRPVRRRRGWVHRRVTKSRGHRKTVSRVTIRCSQPAGGQSSGQRREHRPVSPGQARSAHLAA
jgi:hypothetical protein